MVAILFDKELAYSTPGYTLEEWENKVEQIARGANFDEDVYKRQGVTTGAPAVRPSRSSRTRDSAPQIRCV